MSNIRYTTEFKLKVIKYYLDNHSVKKTLSEFGIAESTLFDWKKLYDNNCLGQSLDIGYKTLSHMQSHLAKMERIIEIQEILKLPFGASVSEKVKAIDSLEGKYPKKSLCAAVGIPVGTYYNRKRRENNPTVYQRNDEILKPIIREIFINSEYRLGKRPIKRLLLERGFKVAEDTISRLMKEMSLSVQKPNQISYYKKPISRKYLKNKLKNNYSPTAPNTVWASDITYVKLNDENRFICIVMDLFSRKVISFSISDRIDTMMTIEAFNEAFKKRGQPHSLVFHSDQGVQYTCTAFRECLSTFYVEQSFSTPGCPTENAVCESFFARMKYEALYRQVYSTTEELRDEVEKYIDYYNNRRPHRFLNYKTPTAVETEHFSAQISL